MQRTQQPCRIALLVLAALAAVHALPACPPVPAVLLSYSHSLERPADPPNRIQLLDTEEAFRLTGYFESQAPAESATSEPGEARFVLVEFALAKAGLQQESFAFRILLLTGQRLGYSTIGLDPVLPFGSLAIPRGFLQLCRRDSPRREPSAAGLDARSLAAQRRSAEQLAACAAAALPKPARGRVLESRLRAGDGVQGLADDSLQLAARQVSDCSPAGPVLAGRTLPAR